jgi:hypothetical protein
MVGGLDHLHLGHDHWVEQAALTISVFMFFAWVSIKLQIYLPSKLGLSKIVKASPSGMYNDLISCLNPLRIKILLNTAISSNYHKLLTTLP